MVCASGSPEICISPAASSASRVVNRVSPTTAVIVTFDENGASLVASPLASTAGGGGASARSGVAVWQPLAPRPSASVNA